MAKRYRLNTIWINVIRSDLLALHIQTAILEQPASVSKILQATANGFSTISTTRDWREMYYARGVDIFLKYMSDIITLAIKAHPEMLSSKSTETHEFILKFSSIDELRKSIIDRKIDDLAYKGFTDLVRYVKAEWGFTILDEESAEFGDVRRYIEIRNAIVHNDGRLSSTVLRRIPDFGQAEGEFIDLPTDEPQDVARHLVNIALDIDSRALIHWRLEDAGRPLSATEAGKEVLRHRNAGGDDAERTAHLRLDSSDDEHHAK
jgi:hypothetical protein